MCAPHFFSAEGSNVRAKNCVSISDVGGSDWAIFNHVSTYHALEVTRWWAADHALGLSGLLGISDLEVGKPFYIYFNCMYHGCFTLPWGAVMVV